MYQITHLSHADAQAAIQAIQTELQHRNKAAVLAVADAHGELIAFLRMDGAARSSILIAINKAFTAARTGQPSRDFGQAARDPKDGFDMAYMGDPRYIGWGGGVPVIVNGVTVGAVAVSGLPEAEDMEVVQLGIAAILNQ